MSNKRFIYKTAKDFYSSENWDELKNIHAGGTDRVFSSTRLEDMVYSDLRENMDIGLDEIEAAGTAKLNTFPELVRDVFQSLYSLSPKKNPVEELTAGVKQFNSEIIKAIESDARHSVLKNICEGKGILSYEAIAEFMEQIGDKLDELLSKNSDKTKANTADVLTDLERQLSYLVSQLQKKENQELSNKAHQELMQQAHSAISKKQQIDHLSKEIHKSLEVNKSAISVIVSDAVGASIDKSKQIETLLSWGHGDPTLEAYEINKSVLDSAKNNPKIMKVLPYLGKFRELSENTRQNSFAYGRGTKYDIALGHDYTKAISSEFAYLATEETRPLFYKKVMTGTLKQYRKRAPISKGHGDAIVMIDESGSMRGDPIAWAKALAITIMEQTLRNGRKCALIRFSSASQTTLHEFVEGEYTFDDILAYVDGFYGGGTNFVSPLNMALALIEKGDYKNADAVILSDGDCWVDPMFLENYKEHQAELGFSLTTVLLGIQNESSALSPISKKVFLGKDIIQDGWAEELLGQYI
ncbi:VWA domain-containing protein [Tyzzerella sp. OttesenSCG-928-J15]|nr:VWA domain-containing protein [Tyzzerella sp. OttesenSCG-928-J15]